MTRGKNKVAVLVENMYEDLELWVPYFRLQEEGAVVRIIGTGKGNYPSKHGYPAAEDESVESVNFRDFDAVIIPGGYAPDYMRRSDEMVRFVKDADGEGKIIAAICHGGWMLASAGVLNKRRVTGFFSIQDDLVNAGALFEDREVVRDGNLITSRSPKDLPAFCRTIVKALKDKK